MLSLSRGAVLRVLAAMTPLLPPRPSLARTPRQKASVTVPMVRCGGAFCVEHVVDGQRVRAVADTGSPFLLVDGQCSSGRWGCYNPPTSLSLGDRSDEGYGGQDVSVEWRRGDLLFNGFGGDMLGYSPVNFGVVRSSVGKGGTQAIYLGLAKDRAARVRPSFLEQTDIRCLSFDFARERLTLARRPLILGDAVPLIDLRPLGAPVGPYAFAVHRLIINGAEVRTHRARPPRDRTCAGP